MGRFRGCGAPSVLSGVYMMPPWKINIIDTGICILSNRIRWDVRAPALPVASPCHLILFLMKYLLPLALISVSGFPLAHAQGAPSTPPDIVSGWKLDGGDTVITFLLDGTYYFVDGSGARPGMERGTFEWDKGSGGFTSEALLDTNGDAGLSHPIGATTISISGNTLTYTVAGEGSFTLSRITSGTQPMVGSWFIPEEKCMVTFLADGSYYLCQEKNDAPYGYDGIERGTYAWNSTTKAFHASAIVDTSGDTGLSHQLPGITVNLAGNQLTLTEGGDQFVLQRVNANPNLRIDNEFEVNKFAGYEQTSGAAPVIEGYAGAAYMDGITGSGGTLTIGSQSARTFTGDDLEVDYATLAALEASTAFPNGLNYLFQRPGGSATLTYPVGGSFFPAPQIASGGGVWSGGGYSLDSKNLLSWTPIAGYDPSSHVTVITVIEEGGEEYLFEHVMPGDVNSFDFTNRLTPGATYDVTVEHVKMVNSTMAGTGPFAGKLGYSLYNTHTSFRMRAFQDGASSAPQITEPVTVKTVNASSVILTVGTNSTAATYQWLKDEEEIEGQTGNSLAVYAMTPDDFGAYRVRVTNAAGSTLSDPLSISSAPAAPEITVSQPAGTVLSYGWIRNFGSIPLGGTSDLVFTLGNVGTLNLNGIAVNVTGSDAGDFSVVSAPTGTLAPGGSVTLTVRYAPVSAGSKEAVLRIVSNDGDESPFTVSLTGTATDPISQPSAPAAPVVNPGTGRPEQTVTINNAGTAGMSGLQLRIDGLPDGVTVVGGTYHDGSSSLMAKAFPKAPGGYWLLDYAPVIKSGSNANVVIQYQFTGAPVSFTPVVGVAPVAAAGAADPDFSRAVQRLTANPLTGSSSLDVRTVPGRRYEVWHSANLVNWQRAGAGIFSRGGSLTWTDNGSETGQAPSSQAPRFYRVQDVTE